MLKLLAKLLNWYRKRRTQKALNLRSKLLSLYTEEELICELGIKYPEELWTVIHQNPQKVKDLINKRKK